MHQIGSTDFHNCESFSLMAVSLAPFTPDLIGHFKIKIILNPLTKKRGENRWEECWPWLNTMGGGEKTQLRYFHHFVGIFHHWSLYLMHKKCTNRGPCSLYLSSLHQSMRVNILMLKKFHKIAWFVISPNYNKNAGLTISWSEWSACAVLWHCRQNEADTFILPEGDFQ